MVIDTAANVRPGFTSGAAPLASPHFAGRNFNRSRGNAMATTFKDEFPAHVSPGDSITTRAGGFDVTATIHEDGDAETPWDGEDGHGPVSEWTNRAKRPGERVLIEDSRGKQRRLYDVTAALEIARRDGWDAEPYGTGTKRERAARAVEADFKYLRAYCRDEWQYVGVVLSVSRRGIVLDKHAASLWRIEANCGHNDYLTEVANELLPEALEKARATLEALTAAD